jgi:hypothetical protein
MKHRNYRVDSGFTCVQCHQVVSADPEISGVNNRNHCPLCLYSRHVDLDRAGDREAECKSKMRPVGLTVKRLNKKYGSQQGELMIIHQCVGCEKISINRIAADDDTALLLAVFESGQNLEPELRRHIQSEGIQILGAEDKELVHTRLFGKSDSD